VDGAGEVGWLVQRVCGRRPQARWVESCASKHGRQINPNNFAGLIKPITAKRHSRNI
jgi:hypothetical protein